MYRLKQCSSDLNALHSNKKLITSNEYGECCGDGDDDNADLGEVDEKSECGGVIASTVSMLSVQVSKSLTVCFSAAIFKAKFSCRNLALAF